MSFTRDLLASQRWTLRESRAAAAAVFADARKLRSLLSSLSSDDPKLRLRAADTARRISERDPTRLRSHAQALIDVLEGVPIAECRTRWHLALAAARAASTSAARLRLAPTLMQWTQDKSNEVRCCALEGLGELAKHEASLRPSVRLVAEESLYAHPTPALACRARRVLRILAKHDESKLRLGAR